MQIRSAHIPIGVIPKPAPADNTAPREPIGAKHRTIEPVAELAKTSRSEKAPEPTRELKPLVNFPNQDSRTNTYLNIAHYDQDFPLIDVYA